MTTRFRLALGFGFALVAACADDTDCPRLNPCVVTERACQEHVMQAMACMRHSEETALPKVSVIDQRQYRNRLYVESLADDDAEQNAADYAVWNRGLALFSLAPADYDQAQVIDDQVDQVAAAYLPRTKEIVVIAGVAHTTEEEVETFAHEVVHALQDAELDLAKYSDKWGTDYDSAIATHALIEGEAVHYQVLAAIELAGRRDDELDWEGFYSSWREETLWEADEDPAPVALASLRFSYAFGGGFVSQHWLARGRAGIDQLLEAPPRSTREMMFGAFDGRASAQRKLDAHGLPELADGFEPAFATSLGAWITRMFAGRMDVPIGMRLQGPLAVAADRFSIQFDVARDAVAAAWRVRFVDDSRAGTWPGLAMSAPLANESASAEDGREAFTVVGEGDQQPEPDELTWRSADDGASPENTATSAIGLPRSFGNMAGVFSCNPRRPHL